MLKYFSECILDGTEPEPHGKEGYADVRVLEGIACALETGLAQTLEPFTRMERIATAREQRLSARKSPELARTSNPGRDKEKVPKLGRNATRNPRADLAVPFRRGWRTACFRRPGRCSRTA